MMRDCAPCSLCESLKPAVAGIAPLLVVLLGILLLCLAYSHARAHSWYPPGCCNSRADDPMNGDCEPVPCDELTENKDGTWSYHAAVFEKGHVHPSQDQYCHACVAKWNPSLGLCAFIQMSY